MPGPSALPPASATAPSPASRVGGRRAPRRWRPRWPRSRSSARAPPSPARRVQQRLVRNQGAAQANHGGHGPPAQRQPALGLPDGARQSQAAREQLQRSVGNLGRTAASIAAQRAAQRAAAMPRPPRRRGAGRPGGGRSQGGRQSLTAGWRNARAPVQTAANGRVNVAIEQTGEKAILNWETFNVGAIPRCNSARIRTGRC